MKVLYTDVLYDGSPTIEREVLGPDIEIEWIRAHSGCPVPEASWTTCDAIVVAAHPIDEELLSRMTRCRGIACCGTGTDHVDLTAAARRGIPVCNVPDHATVEVADFAITMVLNLARGVATLDQKARQVHGADWFLTLSTQRRLHGKRFGVVGLGLIGMATAKRASAFDMEVAFYDPYARPGIEMATGYRRFDDLDELLGWSDIVSLHAGLTDETRRLINAQRLSKFKEGALLVNVGRGGVVDLDAVHGALKSGRLGGVGLDVLPDEPPDDSHPLIAAWRASSEWMEGRVLITPHAAYYSLEEAEHQRRRAAANAKALLMGEIPSTCVNRSLLEAA